MLKSMVKDYLGEADPSPKLTLVVSTSVKKVTNEVTALPKRVRPLERRRLLVNAG